MRFRIQSSSGHRSKHATGRHRTFEHNGSRGASWRTVDRSFSEFTTDRDDDKSNEYGARILWDTGIAPGLSNMLLSRAYDEMGPLKKGEVRVGGNPTGPTGGWNYMAPFSPIDVIAEYTRPARVIRAQNWSHCLHYRRA